ncbi:MAG: NHL repeat-containing protein [Candidatus Zixiibacteriota bacterium]
MSALKSLAIVVLLYALPAGLSAQDFRDRVSVTAIALDDGSGASLRGAGSAYFDRQARELFVCDGGHNQVIIYDENLIPKFAFRHFVPSRDSDRLVPGEPKAVVTNSRGEIILLDNLAQFIDVLDFRGEPLQRVFPNQLIGDTTLRLTCDALAVDDRDNLYVVVGGDLQTILVLDQDFLLKRKIGRKGPGESDFTTLLAIAEFQGRLYLTDLLAKPAIKVFDTSGAYLSGFGAHEVEKTDFSLPGGITVTVDSSGTPLLWFCDALRQIVKVIDAKGNFISEVGGFGYNLGEYRYPSGIASDGRNIVFVVEKVGARVQKFEYR